ncbi:MAG: DUF3526 domain-containing protein [Acidobacteriota bacterium]
MILTVMRHEWRLMRRSPVSWWAAGLLLAATAYALAGGLAWQQERADEAVAIAETGASMLAEQRASAAEDGGAVSQARTYAALPPGPLAAFSVGLADLLPKHAEISIWRRPDTLFGRYQLESPLSLLAGRFDLGFVVLYLLPLFILALSYDLLAAEREGGRLSLVLTQPLSLPGLLAAKLLARLVLLTAFLAVVAAAAALAGAVPALAWPRLIGWLAVAWLYGALWLAVCALVAAFARRSETCAATLAAIWLIAVLVIPGLLEAAVGTLRPVPSRLEYVTAMRAASSEASQASSELLAQYYHEHPELAANGEQGGFLPAYYASERDVERRLEPLLADFEQRLVSQQAWVERWRFASPAVLAQEALIELAGSSQRRHRQFQHDARAFLADWHAEMSPRIFLGQQLAPADYDGLPSFGFSEPAVSRQHFAGTVAGLTLPALLALVVAYRRLDRFEVAS